MAERLKLLLRVCAVGSSLILVAAFVGYRAGALGVLLQVESRAVAAGPAPETESETESDGDSLAEEPTEKPVLLGGSKSGVLSDLLPTPTEEPRPPRPRATATESPDDTVILSGSKSLVLDSRMPKKPARPAKEKDATPTPASNE